MAVIAVVECPAARKFVWGIDSKVRAVAGYTLNGEELHIFKRLEMERHESFEFICELFVGVLQAVVNRFAKGFEIAVKMIVQALFLQKLPVTLNQV